MNKLRIGLLVSAIIIAIAVVYFFVNGNVGKSETVTKDSTKEESVTTKEVQQQENVETYQNVAPDKEWVIELDGEISEGSLNAIVNDEKGKDVGAAASLNEENTIISVKPPQGGYQKGGYYELFISGLKYTDGSDYPYNFKLIFIIQRDEVEVVEYDKSLINIKQEDYVDIDEKKQIVTLKMSKDLKVTKDDIIVLPVREGKAVKVVKVEENNNQYIIEYTQPRFAEVIEELDIYKTYSLFSDEVQFIPAEGVDFELVSAIEPNTMVASSSSKTTTVTDSYRVSNEEKERIVRTMPDYTKNILDINLNEIPIKNGLKTSAHITVSHPEILLDYKRDKWKIDRLNTEVSGETKFEGSFFYTAEKEKKNKKLSGEIPLGTAYTPTLIPGIVLSMDIAFAYGLNGKGEITGELVANASYKVKSSLVKKNDDYEADIGFEKDETLGLRGRGSFGIQAGVEPQVGISALEVVGLGFENFIGLYGDASLSVYGNNKGEGACGATSTGFAISMGVVLDTLMNIPLFEYKIGEKKVEFSKLNTCKKVTDLDVFPRQFENLKPGDEIELDIKGVTRDLTSGQTDEVEYKLVKDFKNVKFTTSNKDVATIKVQKTKKGKKKDDDKVKVILVVNKKPADDNAKIFIEYEDKSVALLDSIGLDSNTLFTKELLVTVDGVKKEVPKDTAKANIEDIKKIYDGLQESISTVFQDTGIKYQWGTGISDSDFALLSPSLKPIATDAAINGKLKELSKNYCFGGCGAPFLPVATKYGIRFEIHESSNDTIIFQYSTPQNEVYDDGSTYVVTMKNEDGQWKFDGFDVTYSVITNFTKEEAEHLINANGDGSSKFEFVKEVTGEFPFYNQATGQEEAKTRTLYIFENKTYGAKSGMFADNGQGVYDEALLSQ